MTDTPDGWNEYKKLVVSELERLDGDIKGLAKKIDDVKDTLTTKIDSIRGDMIVIKVKMALIGAIAGGIMSAIFLIIGRVVAK